MLKIPFRFWTPNFPGDSPDPSCLMVPLRVPLPPLPLGALGALPGAAQGALASPAGPAGLGLEKFP